MSNIYNQIHHVHPDSLDSVRAMWQEGLGEDVSDLSNFGIRFLDGYNNLLTVQVMPLSSEKLYIVLIALKYQRSMKEDLQHSIG